MNFLFAFIPALSNELIFSQQENENLDLLLSDNSRKTDLHPRDGPVEC